MRQEHRHHSDEQVADALAAALALVDELGMPDDLRVEAFKGALNLLTAKSIVEMQAPPIGVPNMQIPRQR